MTTREKIREALNRSADKYDYDCMEALIIEFLTEHPSACINVDFSDKEFHAYSNDKWMDVTIPARWTDDFLKYLQDCGLYYVIGYNSRIAVRIQYTPIF